MKKQTWLVVSSVIAICLFFGLLPNQDKSEQILSAKAAEVIAPKPLSKVLAAYGYVESSVTITLFVACLKSREALIELLSKKARNASDHSLDKPIEDMTNVHEVYCKELAAL